MSPSKPLYDPSIFISRQHNPTAASHAITHTDSEEPFVEYESSDDNVDTHTSKLLSPTILVTRVLKIGSDIRGLNGWIGSTPNLDG